MYHRTLLLLSLIFTTLCQPFHSALGADKHVSTPILGETMVDAEQMWRFVCEENADFPPEIAQHYYDVGKIYGIRGDIALCQAILETGWFKFDKGTAVEADQHNYCGLGVLKRGMKGHSFSTPRDGVTAQIQHLYAYASKEPLPEGETKLDKRFGLVKRGCAATWEDLSGKWAANKRYAKDILHLFNRMLTSSEQIPAEQAIFQESFADKIKRIVKESTDATNDDSIPEEATASVDINVVAVEQPATDLPIMSAMHGRTSDNGSSEYTGGARVKRRKR